VHANDYGVLSLECVCSPLLVAEQSPVKTVSSNEELSSQRSCCSASFLVPALITSSDLIGSLASGENLYGAGGGDFWSNWDRT
jgi:hypothetical protein